MAEANGLPIGFMTMNPEGFIDLAFVSPSALGKGVGWKLYKVVEEKILNLGALVLSTEASMAARLFFERQGYSSNDKAILRTTRLVCHRRADYC